jgi:hypothetical protein
MRLIFVAVVVIVEEALQAPLAQRRSDLLPEEALQAPLAQRRSHLLLELAYGELLAIDFLLEVFPQVFGHLLHEAQSHTHHSLQVLPHVLVLNIGERSHDFVLERLLQRSACLARGSCSACSALQLARHDNVVKGMALRDTILRP